MSDDQNQSNKATGAVRLTPVGEAHVRLPLTIINGAGTQEESRKRIHDDARTRELANQEVHYGKLLAVAFGEADYEEGYDPYDHVGKYFFYDGRGVSGLSGSFR